ncbi:hypothetical protein ACFLXH_01000 [Chloroflexota bacterium]
MVLTRNEFVGLVRNTIAGLGFAPEEAIVTFPINLFLAESDLSPIKENLDKFIEGLTTWQPIVKRGRSLRPPKVEKVEIEGKDYEEAAIIMNTLFLRNLWGDGLPLVPPTEERVNWILRGTDISPEIEIGRIMPRGGIATVQTLAISLAMAGGRPEYLPVLIAAIKAIIDPALNHQQFQVTSCSVFPVAIINGQIAKQIRLNSGFGLLGPAPQHPAGGVIGRAIRLIQQNVGGAIPGSGTMAMFGGMRYTNAVFAEDEEGLPLGWEPFGNEYFGAARGVNSVTVVPASGATNILRRGTGKETLEEEVITSLYIIASYLRSFNVNSFAEDGNGTQLTSGDLTGRPLGVLLISSTVAVQLANLGWNKSKIREFLWENTKIPLSKLRNTGFIRWIEYYGNTTEKLPDPWPITSKPENIMIVIAGGRHPTHAYWLQSAFASKAVNREINLPSNWGELINEAEKELGPIIID